MIVWNDYMSLSKLLVLYLVYTYKYTMKTTYTIQFYFCESKDQHILSTLNVFSNFHINIAIMLVFYDVFVLNMLRIIIALIYGISVRLM